MDEIKIPITEFSAPFLFAAIFTAELAWVGRVGILTDSGQTAGIRPNRLE